MKNLRLFLVWLSMVGLLYAGLPLSEDISADGDPRMTLNTYEGDVRIVAQGAGETVNANDSAARWSPDYLLDADLEDDQTNYRDAWDDDGVLQWPWGYVAGTTITVTKSSAANALYGKSSISFDTGAAQDTTCIVSQSFIRPIANTVADSYILSFVYDNATDANLDYQLIYHDQQTDDTTTKNYYTGSAWSTTETWNQQTTQTSATRVFVEFEADSPTVAGEDEHYEVRFRISDYGAGAGSTFLDKVMITESALDTDAFISSVPSIFRGTQRGRWSFRADSTTVINISAVDGE